MVGLSGIEQERNAIKKEQVKIYEYSKNPFTPSGRMGRALYFVYSFLLRICDKFITILDKQPDFYENMSIGIGVLFIILCFYLCACSVFVVKKRILDITLNNKKSWIYSIVFCLSTAILYSISQYCCIVLAPFGWIILFTPAKEKPETYLGIPESKTETIDTKCQPRAQQKISFVYKKIINFTHNIINNKKNILLIMLCVCIIFVLFRIICFEQIIQGNKVITINKITGNATYTHVKRNY